MNWKSALFDVAWYTGAHRLAGRRYRAEGTVLMMHRVTSHSGEKQFSPNQDIEITPDFFRQLLQYFRDHRWDIISLDELAERISEEHTGNPFICLTFDDGYQDNLDVALPICREFDAPMAIYLTTGLIDRTHLPWWYMVEDLLQRSDQLELPFGEHWKTVSTETTNQKYSAFDRIRQQLVSSPDIAEPLLDGLTRRYSFTLASFRPDLLLKWDGVRELIKDDLVTIGGHAVSHEPLSQLDTGRILSEMNLSSDSIESECGIVPSHFCYPFGGTGECGEREYRLAEQAGYKTATTTRQSNLTHRGRPSMFSIPRIPVKGGLQKLRYIEMSLSGFIPALYNPMKRY